MAKLINQSEYARTRGYNLKTVRDAIAAGHIPVAKKEGIRVMLDPEVCDKEWAKNRMSVAGKGKGDEYSKARAIREKANAEKAVLEVAEYKKTLIKKEDVKKEISSIAFNVKERLRVIPQKISAEVAAETDIHLVEILLQKEIDEALSGLQKLKDKL